MQVIDTELFDLLREKHGKGFQQLVEEKVVALAGDMRRDGLGLEAAVLDTRWPGTPTSSSTSRQPPTSTKGTYRGGPRIKLE